MFTGGYKNIIDEQVDRAIAENPAGLKSIFFNCMYKYFFDKKQRIPNFEYCNILLPPERRVLLNQDNPKFDHRIDRLMVCMGGDYPSDRYLFIGIIDRKQVLDLTQYGKFGGYLSVIEQIDRYAREVINIFQGNSNLTNYELNNFFELIAKKQGCTDRFHLFRCLQTFKVLVFKFIFIEKPLEDKTALNILNDADIHVIDIDTLCYAETVDNWWLGMNILAKEQKFDIGDLI